MMGERLRACLCVCVWMERRESLRANKQIGGKESLIHKFMILYHTILALICAPMSSFPFALHMLACACVWVRMYVCMYGERACIHGLYY